MLGKTWTGNSAMAELIVLSYKPGNSFLHNLDSRCKLFILLLINILSLNAAPRYLASISVLLTTLFVWQKIPLKAALLQTRLFFLLLLFVWLTRAFFTPGDALIKISGIMLTREGMVSGALYCWRLVIILIAGILVISTSKTLEIKGAIQWFLKPVPLLPEKRVAMMISLMIRFLPLILEQGNEISDAQKSRGVEQVKNPVKRLSIYTVPLMRRIFSTADRLVLAMEARCYSEQRTDPELSFSIKDLIVLILTTCFTLTAFFL
jgi:energy-coupling factor transporter transmembrane protein EcfT